MSMKGRICLVTGATSGIGKETAMELAKRGATVVMTSRNQEKGAQVQKEIKALTNNDQIDVLPCDLASFESIRDCAKAFKAKYDQLHVLVNNAGIWETKRSVTKDGLESHFAVNHLAPFLLTNLLLDVIQKSAPARIVNVSSAAHSNAVINFDDLEGKKSYSSFRAYGQSKLADILFTKQLAAQLQDSGVTVNCLHPGVVATALFDKMGRVVKIISKLFMISPQKGAQTSVYLATSPDVENITGKYFAKKKIKVSSKGSNDMYTAKKLWDVSETMVGFF